MIESDHEREVEFWGLFWSKVDIGTSGFDGCWIWTGSRTRGGYGQGLYPPRTVGEVPAHRVSWVYWWGPIPVGLDVCHDCDNPPCVNPYHLFLGTRKDNMRDAMWKGRLSKHPINRKKVSS